MQIFSYAFLATPFGAWKGFFNFHFSKHYDIYCSPRERANQVSFSNACFLTVRVDGWKITAQALEKEIKIDAGIKIRRT